MSLVPDVLDALAARLTQPEQAALSGVQIYDGPETKQAETEFVAIGVLPDEDTGSSPMAGGRTPAGISATTQSVEVPCWIHTQSGDIDIPTRRSRAFALLDAVVAELARDPSLGGACSIAEVADSLSTIATVPEVGCSADIVLTIRARLF